MQVNRRSILFTALMMLSETFALSQNCPNEGGFVRTGGDSGEEVSSDGCVTGVTPKGRKWAFLIYDVTFGESTTVYDPPRNPAAILMNIEVSVQGQNLFRRTEIVTPALFSGIERFETTAGGRTYTIYKTLHVEKLILLDQLAAGGDTTMQLSVRTTRTGADPQKPDGLQIQAYLHSDIRLALRETPYSFIPKDSSDPSAVSGCSGDLDTNCYPTYLAGIVYSMPENQIDRAHKLNGKIRFILEGVSSLTGNSTNNGSATTPDYAIDATKQVQGLFETFNGNRVITRLLQRNEPNQAHLKLTSLDYGGTARLRAEYLPGGGEDPLPAQIDASASPNAQPASPSCNCATLPYDSDGNDIADTWEAGLLGPGGRFDPLDDKEPGTSPTAPLGDGLIARDEYRGFHYIQRQGTQPSVRFSRTDAKFRQDVFFWDKDQKFYARVPDILGVQDSVRIYREVHAEQANRIRSPIGGEKGVWVAPIDRNTRTTNRQRRNMALVLLDRLLGPAGEIGNAQSRVSDGTPIFIDRSKIALVSNQLQMPNNTLLAQVVAHEVGHKFSLDHYKRVTGNGTNGFQLVPVSLANNQLSQLGGGQFVLSGSPSNTMFIRLRAYFDTVLNVERIADGEDIVFNGRFMVVVGRKIAVADPVNRFHVYELTLKDPIRAVSNQGFPPLVEVKAGIGNLMDWSPRTILRLPSQWSFLPTDNANLCVLNRTCVTP